MVSFRLESLPYVAIRTVLNVMDPVEILELTLNSKKMEQLVRSHRIIIDSLTLGFRRIEVKFRNSNYLIINFGGSSATENNDKQRIINGRTFYFWTVRESSIDCLPTDFCESILAVFNFFQNLFIVKNYIYDIEGPPVSFIRHFMSHIPSKCKSVTIGEESECAEDVKRILDHLEITDELKIHSMVTTIHPKMLKVRSLFLVQINQFFPQLLDLASQTLRIQRHLLTDDNIQNIFRAWWENPGRKKELYIQADPRMHNNLAAVFLHLKESINGRKSNNRHGISHIALTGDILQFYKL